MRNTIIWTVIPVERVCLLVGRSYLGSGSPMPFAAAFVATLAGLSSGPATAQNAGGSGSTPLPQVTVTAPAQKPTPPKTARAPIMRAAAAPVRTQPTRRPPAPTAVTRAARTAPSAPRNVAPPQPGAPAAVPGTPPAVAPVADYVPRVSATGTKTATPLIETPQSISVIGAEEIRDREARSLVEATRYTSGVVSETFGNDTRNDFLLIRGFPAQQDGYFLDGLQLASPGFATFRIEPFNLERLEVLKGPASVLYGGSTTGGIINGVSKRPPDVFSGYIESGIDNYGNAYNHFDIGGPVTSDPRFLYRVEGVARGGDTQTNFTPDDRLAIAPSLTFKPDGATTITVLGSYQKDRTRGENFLPYDGTVRAAPFGRIPTTLFASDPNIDTFQRNQGLVGYAYEQKLTDVFTVRQNLRYSDLRINDRTLEGLGYDGAEANANLARLNFNTTPHLTELAVDTQGEARFRTGPFLHTVLAGVDYKHFTLADLEGFTGSTSLNLLAPAYAPQTIPPLTGIRNFNSQDQLGEYLQEQAKFGHLTLVLSGRHDTLQQGLINELDTTKNAQNTVDAFTGRAGLIYTTDSGFAPYVTAATSFDPQLGTNNATGALLLPETGQLVEVGAKYQPVGTRLSFTGALFNLVQQNVPTTDPTNINNTVQTGEERSRGFELEVQGKITDGLKVIGAYTGYHITNTQSVDPTIIGKVPVATPQNVGSLFLDYTIQTGTLRGLGGGAGVRFVGASFADTLNQFGVHSFTLADFAVHYEREHWRVALNLTNAFDRTYVSTCQSVTACFYGQRSRALASLAYKW